MRQLIEFLKTTALGGLFVLLPVLLVYLILAEALELIVALASPIADLFPKGTFDEVKLPVIMGLILIVVLSFIIGLGLRSEIGRRLGGWIERVVLGRMPMYNVLKSLTTGFRERGEDGAFTPAMVTSAEGDRELAYVIEDHGDGYMTVLLPRAPAALAGPLRIVTRDRVEILDTNLGEFTKVLSQWGVGVHELLDKSASGIGKKP